MSETKNSQPVNNSNGLYSRLKGIKTGSVESVLTFVREDGSKQVMSINKELFLDEKGKNRHLSEVVDILKDLQHDFHAKYFLL